MAGFMFGPCSRDASPSPAGEPRPKASHESPVVVDAGRAPARRGRDLDVLLITIDCLRADMPWTGYPRPIAPRLTELAARSVLYTHAYSLSSYTSMSLGGLLGGRLPGEM